MLFIVNNILRRSDPDIPPADILLLDEIMEDREEAAIWAKRSYESAPRAQKSKSKPKKKTDSFD